MRIFLAYIADMWLVGNIEEQPIAIAFSDSRGDQILEELVWEDDLFWGTIYRNLRHSHLSIAKQTTRNNVRFEAMLQSCFPFIPAGVRSLICCYLHLHF